MSADLFLFLKYCRQHKELVYITIIQYYITSGRRESVEEKEWQRERWFRKGAVIVKVDNRGGVGEV